MKMWVADHKEVLLAVGSIAVVIAVAFALFGTPLGDADERSGGMPTRPTSSTPSADTGNQAPEGPPPGPAGRTVRGEDLELHHPDGAVLRITAGALPVDTDVALRTTEADALALLGRARPGEWAWLIDADAEPTRPVELTLPYYPDRLPRDARPLMAMYDGLSGLWLPVETTVDDTAGVVTASVPNFSLTTVIADRVHGATGTVSWLEHQSRNVLGVRAEQPGCSSSPRPSWVSPVVVTPEDGQLLTCVGGAGNGFAIHLANQYGHPVVVAFDRPFMFAQPNGLEPELMRHAGQLVDMSGRGRVTLLPGGTAAVMYDPLASSSGHTTGYVRRDAGAMLLFLAYELGGRAGTDVLLSDGRTIGDWVRECYGRAFTDTSELTTLELTVAGDLLTGCLADVLTREVRRRGLDPDANRGNDLWSRDAEAFGPPAKGMVAGLRLLRALDAGRWMQIAADLVDHGDRVTGLATVSVSWEDTP